MVVVSNQILIGFLLMKNQKFIIALFLAAFSPLVIASGGLDAGTDAISEITGWLYIIIGVISSGYLIYNFGMAYFDKIPWNDVLIALAKVAAGGGSLVAATWAWSIWGS